MSGFRRNLGIWGILILVAVALTLPRLEGQGQVGADESDREAKSRVALEYARQRLWNDFLDMRGEGLAGHSLPAPTLAEYQGYLRALGLSEAGDVVTLYVLSDRASGLDLEQVRVERESRSGGVTLRVAFEEDGHGVPAGLLFVRPGDDRALGCDVEHAADARLWSFWPITAQPLLP